MRAAPTQDAGCETPRARTTYTTYLPTLPILPILPIILPKNYKIQNGECRCGVEVRYTVGRSGLVSREYGVDLQEGRAVDTRLVCRSVEA